MKTPDKEGFETAYKALAQKLQEDLKALRRSLPEGELDAGQFEERQLWETFQEDFDKLKKKYTVTY